MGRSVEVTPFVSSETMPVIQIAEYLSSLTQKIRSTYSGCWKRMPSKCSMYPTLAPSPVSTHDIRLGLGALIECRILRKK